MNDLVAHAPRRLTPLESGGFRLQIEGRSDAAIDVSPRESDWAVATGGSGPGPILRRAACDEPGFVLLEAPDGAEAGRTTRVNGLGARADLYYVLLGDGRLFRIGRAGPRDAGFELTGWETEGAYLVARPGSGGWSLEPTPACGGIADITVLSILFAAEILEAERSLA